MTPALVVLTDFFAVSNHALSYAAGLALPLRAHLVLLHVRHDGLLSPEEYIHRFARSERQTERALHRLADDQPVPTQVEISEAFLPDAVAEAVRHHHPELLVLGRPGTAVQPAEVIVDTALDLLRQVPCPLLTVPTVGWDTRPPRSLVLAVDDDEFTLYKNQEIVRELLDALDGRLSIVHVTNKKDSAAAAVHRVLHAVRHSGIALVPPTATVHLVCHPDAAVGILQGAAELRADLLIVIARRHSLLGSLFHRSVTAQVVCESPIPVLLLPALD